MTTPPLTRLSGFDPKYDPLVARTPGHGRDYAPTYWVGTAGTPPEDDGPLTCDTDVDVAIVGSGFTGLAMYMAGCRSRSWYSHVVPDRGAPPMMKSGSRIRPSGRQRGLPRPARRPSAPSRDKAEA